MQERQWDFGAELRRRRESAGVSLTALAAAIHFTKGHLSKVENGRVRPNRGLAELYDRALGANGELARLITVLLGPTRSRYAWSTGMAGVGKTAWIHFLAGQYDEAERRCGATTPEPSGCGRRHPNCLGS